MKKTMRTIWKRYLALFVAAMMLLAAVPALAEDTAPAWGKVEKPNITGPYEIEATTVAIPSRDITLDAILTVPKGEAEQYPMAILTHGFLGNYGDCENLAEYLGKHGVASIRISLMGSGNSGGLYENSDFTTQADDIINALHYAKTLDVTDARNLFLVGKSQGGFDSALAALQVEDEINGVCLWFPAMCIPDDYRSGRIMFKEFDVNNVPEKVEMYPGYAVGKKMIEQALAMNIEEVFPVLEKDVLFIHGDADQLVKSSYSQQLYSLYPSADLILIHGGGHGFQGQDELDALSYTYAFILSHLVP